MSLTRAQTSQPRVTMTTLIEDTLAFAAASKAENTIRQYASSWGVFRSFCTQYGLQYLPSTVQVIAAYLSHLAKQGKAVSTIVAHMAAIRHFHDQARATVEWSDPILTSVMSGIRRTSTRKVEKAKALLPETLTVLVGTIGAGLIGTRDKALLLVGFAGALRRSEITATTVENTEFVEEGMVLSIRRSKTDQEGRGTEVAIPYSTNPVTCPVRALRVWLGASGIVSGAVFRRVTKQGVVGGDALSEEAIRRILAKITEAAGIDAGEYSPHSLRSGFCTGAAINGASLPQIAQHARHASIQTTMGYVRVADRFKNHAGASLL